MMVPALALAACGDGADGALVEGTFGPGLEADGVWVMESDRHERARDGGFRLEDLSPGPATMRLMRGADTAALLNLSGLPPGARLVLRELRVDGDSRMAFPRAVELRGANVVTVNGVRLAPDGRIPGNVDVRGAVLAWSSDFGALLVRPDEQRLPDLRVVVGPATEVVGTDGGGADPVNIRPGDSVRVEGRRDEGYVVASRITVPTRIGAAPASDPRRTDDDGDARRDRDDDPDERSGGVAAAPVSRSAPAATAPRPAVRRDDGPGKGRGRGEGKGKGKKGRDGGTERD